MIVMDEITFAEAEAGHRELWDWMAKTGGDLNSKDNWPGWGGYDRKAYSSCFACELACELMCQDRANCPVEWPDGTCHDGIHAIWCHERDPAERKRLAAEIRDLPWRE
jgi:hypothetical protein